MESTATISLERLKELEEKEKILESLTFDHSIVMHSYGFSKFSTTVKTNEWALNEIKEYYELLLKEKKTEIDILRGRNSLVIEKVNMFNSLPWYVAIFRKIQL